MKNVGEGEDVKFNITFQNFKIKCPFKAFVWLFDACVDLVLLLSQDDHLKKRLDKRSARLTPASP